MQLVSVTSAASEARHRRDSQAHSIASLKNSPNKLAHQQLPARPPLKAQHNSINNTNKSNAHNHYNHNHSYNNTNPNSRHHSSNLNNDHSNSYNHINTTANNNNSSSSSNNNNNNSQKHSNYHSYDYAVDYHHSTHRASHNRNSPHTRPHRRHHHQQLRHPHGQHSPCFAGALELKPIVSRSDERSSSRSYFLRKGPLTIDEYETHFRRSATDLELVERVYAGSIACNELRAALWPYLFGITKHRDRFERRTAALDEEASDDGNHLDLDLDLGLGETFSCAGSSRWQLVDHEANVAVWRELREAYQSYRAQWEAIRPEQESRFSTFRERKALIERDVVRCDRVHPFYADAESQNLEALNDLLMTYMMYDFDIGYLQGMSDLAAPILYVFGGDLVRSFWVFVEVMKLFRRNFEHSQKTILFQMNCLFSLIKLTDPKFARYLTENDSANCFFALRSIMCQFKRELMKNEHEADYTKVLMLWDTVWCVQRRHELLASEKIVHTYTVAHAPPSATSSSISPPAAAAAAAAPTTATTPTATSPPTTRLVAAQRTAQSRPISVPLANVKQAEVVYTRETFYASFDPNQADVPRVNLTETEKFVLALCMSLVCRQRDQVLHDRLEASELHQLFLNPPHLARDLNEFVEGAYTIYNYLNTDCDLKRITRNANNLNGHQSKTAADSLAAKLTPGEANEEMSGSPTAGGPPAHHHHLLARSGAARSASNGEADSLASSSPDTYELLKDYLVISPTLYPVRPRLGRLS